MASLLGGLAGAGSGFASGGPIGGLIGGLTGLFGGSHAERQTAAQRAALAQQQAIARQLYQFSQSAPMTSPDELGALAQDRGLLGGQQRSELAGLYAGYNPGMQGQMGQADMMGSLASRLMGQQMQMNEQHMLDALGRRRESLLQAANVNQSAAEMAPRQVPSALPQAMSQLMQTIAYQQAMKKGQAQGQTPSIGAIPHANPGADHYLAGGVMPQLMEPGMGGSGAPAPRWPVPPAAPGAPPPGLMSGGGLTPQLVGDDPTLTAILQALVGHLASRKKGTRPRKPKAAVGDPPGSTLGAMMGMGGGTAGPPPGQQGSAAPGNAPQDVNGVANQTRQANLSTRLMRLPNGMVVPY